MDKGPLQEEFSWTPHKALLTRYRMECPIFGPKTSPNPDIAGFSPALAPTVV